MSDQAIPMAPRKRIALVAHDNRKQTLLEWVKFNRVLLAGHELFATGTTGALLERELKVPVTRLQSGPLGGDLQIGAKIAEGAVDFMISSPLMDEEYDRLVSDHDAYRRRALPQPEA